MNSTTEVIAVYFPNFHPYPLGQLYYGENWTEWELVKAARPRFDGHYQPKIPLWGYYDASKPEWAEKENECASEHGVTCWLIDWYWYSGVQMMQEQLEQGFLKSRNRRKMKFALMWANHPWMNFFPVPYDKTASESNVWLPMRHSLRDLESVADYCIEHYFKEDNYLKVDGRLYFSFFSYGILKQELGGTEEVRRGLAKFDERVRRAGLPGMHFGINIANVDVSALCWDIQLIEEVAKAGFHSVFGYNISRSKDYAKTDMGNPLVDYAEVMDSHRKLWSDCTGRSLPFCPTVTVGCDVSPRWHPDTDFPIPKLDYPYEPIVINNTPDRFGELCGDALDYLAATGVKPAMVFLNGWNEWTEGNYLCPEKRHGDAYLKALKQALDGRSEPERPLENA